MTYTARTNFDIGKKAFLLIYGKMNLIPGKLTLKGFVKINHKIPFASKYKEMDSTKNEEK